ncbi:MAG TPA: cytochrome c peroxidase [Gemmatimonadales bacterium]|nr:cytochrome c peroxidase [Gemmatimonadales bacterium]
MTERMGRLVAWWRRWGLVGWPGTAALCVLAVLTLRVAPPAHSADRRPAAEAGDSLRHATPTPARALFEAGLDSLALALDSLDFALRHVSTSDRPAAFRRARREYKTIESLITVFSPATAALLNGPLPEESEDRPAAPLGAPAGFQIAEASLFAGEGPGADSVIRAVGEMTAAVRQFRTLTKYLSVSDATVLDAARLEIARVATLGLAGFDTDASGDGIVESAVALEGTARLAQLTATGAAAAESLRRAAHYLGANSDFARLDRLIAIRDYLEPAARAVHQARIGLAEPVSSLHRLWRTTRASLFEDGALDPSAFAPTFAPAPTPELIALGQRLFFEPRLSGPGTRSCGFCHLPARGFTDGLRVSQPLPGTSTPHPRNTPALLNAAFEPLLFADSRVGSLESQVETVIRSPAEMGGSVDTAAARLAGDSSYQADFARAFRSGKDTTVNARSLRLALAAFVRSLNSLNSRFDRALRGEAGALSRQEQHGFTVFMGKGRCGSCHFLPLMSGTMPPDFATSEPEIIGVPAQPMMSGAALDADPGRGGVDHEPTHRSAFKVPTLRNITLTAPYMHNGVFGKLEEVVEFYERGGGSGIGANVPGQTLPARRLRLTETERRDLVAFLGSLTDPVALSATLAAH